jgi:hypothetical protein
VAVTGAFLTGQPLQVRVAESSAMQRKLGEALRAHGEGWTYTPLEWQDAGGSYDGSGGYQSLVPVALVRRDGDGFKVAVEQALERRPASERAWLERKTRGWLWELRDVSIEVYDFGAGIVRSVYTVQPPGGLDAAQTRRTVDLLSRLKPDPEEGVQSPIAAALDEIARATVARLAAAVEHTVPHARQRPWLTPMVAALGEPDEGRPDPSDRHYAWGRLLWLHPIYILRAPADSDERTVHAIAQPYKSDFHRAIDISYGLFVPGIEISVIVARGDPARAHRAFLSLVSLNWAYYALFMEIDRGLFATLDNDRWQASATIGELEADAAEMFRVYMRVQEAQTRLSSVLMDIGGGALTLWDTIVAAQRFEALVAAVQGKVELLQRVTDRRVQEAATVRARRAGNILGGLTALTVVTVVTAVLDSLAGSRSDAVGHVGLRIAALALAAMTALYLFRAHRDMAMKQRRSLRRRLRGGQMGLPGGERRGVQTGATDGYRAPTSSS